VIVRRPSHARAPVRLPCAVPHSYVPVYLAAPLNARMFGWGCSQLCDLFFIANIFVHLNVGFLDVEGQRVMDMERVRKQYLRSWAFAFDVIGVLPLDLIQAGIGWYPLVRVNRLVRLSFLRRGLTKLQTMSINPTTVNVYSFIRLLFIWLLLPHFFAVVRILLVRIGDDDPWKNRDRNMDLTATPATNYLRNLHWCMGVMSGYSDGTIPEEFYQYIFTIILLNIGLFFFAYTVGVIGAMGEGNAQQSRDFQIGVSAMHHFVTRYDLPIALQTRITDYFAHRWESIKSNEKELVSAAELLEELPPCVRYDAVECMTAEALSKVPLFARVEEGFIHALTQKMEAVSTSVGEKLVNQGEICEGMYIVLKGKMDILVDGKSINVVGTGAVIGEQSMLTGIESNATAVSLSFCELYRLRREPFEELQHKFVETFEGFKQAARLEAKNAKKQAKAQKSKKFGAGAAGGGGPGGGGLKRQATLARMSTRASKDGESLALFGVLPIPIQPHSRVRAIWSLCLILALGWDVFSVPFKIVFVGNFVDTGIVVLDVFADIVVIVDLALRSVLAFTEDGRNINDLKQIRKRFREKRRLIPMAISAVPASIFLPLWPLVDARGVQCIRLLRLARLYPMFFLNDSITRQQPSNLEELLRQVRHSAFDLQFAVNKLAPLLALYLVCVHYVGCAYWAAISAQLPPSNWDQKEIPSWIANNNTALTEMVGISRWLPQPETLTTGQTLLYYFRAFYFATCNLTGLGAAVVPYAVSSVVFTLFCFIMGVMVFAYLTSAIVTLVMQADAAADNFQHTTMSLLGFMQDAGIQSEVIHRASKWLDQWWHAHGGANMDKILEKHLPPSLSEEVRMHVFKTACAASPFWDDPSDGTALIAFADMQHLSEALRFEVYNAGEWVFRKGMLNDNFFIVAHGKLEVILDDGTEHAGGRRRRSVQGSNLQNQVIAEIGVGEILGEHSCINKGKCEASVRAPCSTELLLLPRHAILRLLKRNKVVKHRLHSLMHKRFCENLYFKTGKVTVASAATVMLRLKRVVARWRDKKRGILLEA
jgi:CRP-like cAMP-binding protein